jgi:hypothetical protein
MSSLEQERTEELPIETPTVGGHGDPCTGCGAPLAHDQRYCLNCGRRREGVGTRYLDLLARKRERPQAVSASVPPVAPGPPRSGGWSWREIPAGVAAALVGAAALLFIFGLLIGNAGDNGSKTAVAPQVIRVTQPAAPATTTQPAAFTSDWPDGKNGFTVKLQELPKDGNDATSVGQAKSAATGKGAADVGALDSDDFSSLDGGTYVIYSGVFDTKKQAQKALKGLKKKFPGASVIKVSSGDVSLSGPKKKEGTVGRNTLKQLQNSSPGDYQKKSKKLPDTTKIPGKAPKKDEKKAGGGQGGAEVIG